MRGGAGRVGRSDGGGAADSASCVGLTDFAGRAGLSASRSANHFSADANEIKVRVPTFVSRGPSPCFLSL